MGLLAGKTCYLAGPVEAVADGGQPWRSLATEYLTSLAINSWDPTQQPVWCKLTSAQQNADRSYLVTYSGSENKNVLDHIKKRNGLMRQVCLRLISAADFVICKIGGPTVGTFEELAVARQQGKPILFFTDHDVKLDSMWRFSQFTDEDHHNIFFSSLTEIMNYLINIDNGTQVVDRLKWIFLPGIWRDNAYPG